jgi:hypothetical protein
MHSVHPFSSLIICTAISNNLHPFSSLIICTPQKLKNLYIFSSPAFCILSTSNNLYNFHSFLILKKTFLLQQSVHLSLSNNLVLFPSLIIFAQFPGVIHPSVHLSTVCKKHFRHTCYYHSEYPFLNTVLRP